MYKIKINMHKINICLLNIKHFFLISHKYFVKSFVGERHCSIKRKNSLKVSCEVFCKQVVKMEQRKYFDSFVYPIRYLFALLTQYIHFTFLSLPYKNYQIYFFSIYYNKYFAFRILFHYCFIYFFHTPLLSTKENKTIFLNL